VTPSPDHTHTLWAHDVRLLRSPAAGAVTNMALDEAMIRAAAQTGATLVRLYTWDVPSLSLGRNQRTTSIYNAERCASQQVPVVRRLTGGRALLHAREVTYAVAAPVAAAPSLRGGYDAINQCLLAALHALGVPAVLAAPAERTPSPGLAPCFETPSTGELVVDDRKLVGSAQHREADAFLQHGSLLLDDDQDMLASLALVPLPEFPAPATLRALLGDETRADTVCDAIEAAIRVAANGRLTRWSPQDLSADHVAEAASRYRDPRWTWRR
jgi:lipoyl(octanoyl) transferase